MALPPTAEQQFAGEVGIRSETVRFELLDRFNSTLGELAVSRDESPQLSNDIDQSVRRKVDGVFVPPRPLSDESAMFYAEDLDTLSMRFRPWWVLGTGEEYPLGLFLFGDDSSATYSWGQPRSVTGVDQTIILDQPLEQSVGYETGWNITTAISAQAAAAGFGTHQRHVESSDRTLGAPVAWAAGRDTRLRVIEDLCALVAFLPPYFDNNGTLTCRATPDLSNASSDFVYGFGVGAVVPGSIVSSSDILTAPNRYIALDTGATDTAIVGIYDIPDAAPNSYARTGFRRSKVIEIQGLTDLAAAEAAAAAAYATDSSTYTWLQFDSAADPRHDTVDIIDFDGALYRQQSWSLELRTGGQMHHDCRGVY
jgi:hypothetical protein